MGARYPGKEHQVNNPLANLLLGYNELVLEVIPGNTEERLLWPPVVMETWQISLKGDICVILITKHIYLL